MNSKLLKIKLFLKRIVGSISLKILGWKVIQNSPLTAKKAIIICAPHTSNWDGFYSLCALASMNLNTYLIAKAELNFFPMNFVLKIFGMLTIDRTKGPKSQVASLNKLAEKLKNEKDNFYLAISPEGTRKANPNWKKGFYHLAKKSELPIVLAYLDYKKREAGIGVILYPTGCYEDDIAKIKNFYSDKTPKHPDLFAI